jgi:protein-S-isoprenylcysteine O-methyltransferase Ste14
MCAERAGSNTADGPACRTTARGTGWLEPFGVAIAYVALPAFVYYVWVCLTYYNGAFALPSAHLLQHLPGPTWISTGMVFGWIAFQLLLQIILPGRPVLGAPLADGRRLPYRMNGLLSLIVTVTLLAAFVTAGVFPARVVAEQVGPLLTTANIVAFTVAGYLFVVGRRHNEGGAHRAGAVVRFWQGSELNPRIGHLDLKLFFEARPGLLGWAVLDLSLAAVQWHRLHHLSVPMALICVFQITYIVDYFIHEEAVLSTYDIRHERFGWMLCWGDLVWVPFLYTVQAQYLVLHDPHLSTPFLIGITALNLGGYLVFRRSNLQKHTFRAKPQMTIWGKPARHIETSTGSLLLISGWWGLARHVNYLGDLAMGAAWCLLCGFDHPLPYLYFGYLFVLLLHRERRDNRICQTKYGADWDEYRARVRYRIVPLIY